MFRLLKYLKPFWPLLALAVFLLFVQAMSDLSLPTYLSEIVNVGIQQGGIETAVPQALRQTTFLRLLQTLSPANQQLLHDHYLFVDQTLANETQYEGKYPVLATQPIYLLQPISGSQRNMLDGAFTGAWSGSAQPNRQSAIAAVKQEYLALGMNLLTLQDQTIIKIGFIMLAISLLSGACTIAVGFFSARIAAGFARDLRRYLFRKVESFSKIELDHFTTSSLITRTTNDITQIQTTVMILIRMAFYAPIIGVGGVILALRTSPSMSWMIALAVVLLISLIAGIFSLTVPKFALIQKLLDRLNLVTSENLSGMMVIRAFNTQKFEEKRFDRANRDLTEINLYVNRVMSLMQPLMMLLMSGLSVLIVWVGAHQVAQSHLQVGNMIAFMQYSLQIVFAFMFLSFMFIILPRAAVSASRIADVLGTEPVIEDPEDPVSFPEPFQGIVEFRGVSFRYPGAEEDVLHDLNFTAEPGQTTALIGSTGSGKSTLVDLIPRFYDVTGGAILIDGIDIRQVKQHDLRSKIGYIPQKANLFTGTIESNLRYADKHASAKELQAAVQTSQSAEFIAAKPAGLASEISQGGINVSGGQRQRLSIARALVKQAPIYIFDDSFSALDFRTDVALRRALKTHASGSTLLVVAQRISTIKSAEQIIVLDEGKIVGKGRHEQLMKVCKTYREIALSQLSLEELK